MLWFTEVVCQLLISRLKWTGARLTTASLKSFVRKLRNPKLFERVNELSDGLFAVKLVFICAFVV